MQAQLDQSERVSSLGRLSAVVAHEFNNVLMGISPFVEVIRRSAPDLPKVQNAVVHLNRAIERGKQITQDLLRFTRPAEPSRKEFDLTRWLHDFAREARALLPDRIELDTRFPSVPLNVNADPTQLDQLLRNLVANARDAVEGNGKVTIEAVRPSSPTAGQNIQICVSDTGKGIAPHVAESIFQPLFTTKRNGTGLGLAIARQIVVAHGGTIALSRRSEEGATFVITLPIQS
jgi:signal transduction histidine kinase